MHLSAKTLEMLRELINELTQYRKGHEIISFFAKFDYQDLYQQGFPSRWIYTDQRLSQINGTPKISTCIKLLFSPINRQTPSSEKKYRNNYPAIERN